MQYIERRTRLYIAAFAAAVLILALTLGLTLGLGGTPPTAQTTPTVSSPPVTGITVPTSIALGLGAAKTELARHVQLLVRSLSQFPDPAGDPPARILESVTLVGGIVIGNVASGPNRLLNVRFDIGGRTLDECFTLSPAKVTSRAC